MRHAGVIDADRQTQEVVQTPHPLGIARGQVIGDRDNVHAPTGQGVEVHRQRGGQGFALAGAHFGNFSLVQGDTAY